MKTKGGRSMNPTDAFRKEERRKELKRNKKERKKVREVILLHKDPDTIKKQIENLEAQATTDGALDKARKHKKRQLEDTLKAILKKKEVMESKGQAAEEDEPMFSHLMKPSFLTKKEPSQQTGDAPLPAPLPPPPPRPPLPESSRGLGVEFPPMPPRPPLPSAEHPPGHPQSTHVPAQGAPGYVAGGPPVPGAPPPPPPFLNHPVQPLLPPGVEMAGMTVLPPPPPRPHHDALLLAPPGTEGGHSDSDDDRGSDSGDSEYSDSDSLDESDDEREGGAAGPASKRIKGEPAQGGVGEHAPGTEPLPRDKQVMAIPPPPPPRGVVPPPPPPVQNALRPPFPPPPPLQGVPGAAPPHAPTQPPPMGMRPPPPPPPMGPPPMRPLLMGPPPLQPPPAQVGARLGPPMGPPPMGMLPPPPRPPLGPPPGPPPLMPLMSGVPPPPPPPLGSMPGGPPPAPAAPSKPLYVRSAAPTAVKRQLAHKDPNLTCMVPASVRVRRETAVPARPKKPAAVTSAPIMPAAPAPRVGPSGVGQGSVLDTSYEAFLRDMQELGAME